MTMSFDDIITRLTDGPNIGLWIRTIGGVCPCQADGTMDGHPFYFRARHGMWTLDACKKGRDPLDEIDIVFQRSGDDPDNGYMPEAAAAKIIFECWCDFQRRTEMTGETK